MIKTMRFAHASGMHHGFAWFSIFCFASVVSVADSKSMELHVPPQVTARCGDNVTLPCSFNSSGQKNLQLMTFSLLAEKETKVCEYNKDKADHEYRCVSANKTSHQTLSMILTNIMPVSEGKYICKVHTNMGIKNKPFYVKIQECSGSSGNFRSASQATCRFSGVHPRGVVHWFKGNYNITDDAITKEEKDQNGLYNISSTVDEEGNKLDMPYNCSLWIPSLNKYLFSQKVMSTVFQKKTSVLQEVPSLGTTVKLQWICVVVGILMMSFRM